SPNFFGKMAGHKNLNDYLPRLSNFSGFAQTFSLMGGKITLSDTHVLTIESDEGDLWRGLVYDTYLGNEWTRTEQRFRGGEPKTTHELDARAMPDWQDGPSRINTQRVTIEVPTPGVLIAAATPRKVEFPDRIPGVSQDVYGCVEASLAPDQRSYTVHSAVPFWGPNDLAAAGSTKADYRDVIPDADWEAWENVYIGGVPVETRSALGPLVEEITADCTSAYAKAMAIQAYLYENCKYTLDVPPIPANQDAVTYFVTKTKLGACDLYSSALAIMLRLADVPARVATGYGTGEYSIEKQGYVVTGQEAHAWTEVFFPGYGWVAFDPPSQRAPDRFSWLAKLFQRGWTGPTLRALGKRVGIALILLALVNALVTGVSGSSPAEYIIKWFRARRRSESPRQHVAVAYTSVSRALRKYGVSRSGWQTPTDFARQIGRNEELPDYIRERHGAFTTDFLDLRYGADEPTHSDVRAFTGHADGLARRIRRAARSKGHPPKEQESPPADER
ncbi:MAG TPA: transglutaminase domain-containing protein, partial [Armatimonadota bacterium]|nr:transglutaminase domain-containing protein [Armatimonadota bacterium]